MVNTPARRESDLTARVHNAATGSGTATARMAVSTNNGLLVNSMMLLLNCCCRHGTPRNAPAADLPGVE